jgi:transposase
METPLSVTRIERIDDVPLLLAQMAKMEVAPLLDKHFPTHGNWQGLSLGQVAVVWLAYILSEGDHRLNSVQGWLGGGSVDDLDRLLGDASPARAGLQR